MSRIYEGLIVNRVKLHDYLVMDLAYSKQGTMKLSMIKYLDTVLQDFPENLGLTAVTLAVAHLFKVRNDVKTKYLP